jgi:hypothetical protein
MDIDMSRTPRVIAKFIDYGEFQWFPEFSDEMKEKIGHETANVRNAFVAKGGVQPQSDMMPDI